MNRLTELEAINRMLLGIKLHPAATVDELDVYSEGMIARSVLRQTIMDVLVPGWNFNTRRMTLVPETDGTIPVPAETIDVFCPPNVRYELLVDADGRLLDTLNGTKVFTSAIDCFVVSGYSFSQLPGTHQMLILHRARLSFKREMRAKAGADDRDIMMDIQRAEAAAKAWDTRQKRLSMNDSLRMAQHVDHNWPRRFSI
jgi:hypothetical protein